MKGLYAMMVVAAALSMSACSTSASKEPLSAGGDAYKDVDNIYRLHILPVEVPADIHGNATQLEKERWQEDWPMAGARLIASGVSDETGDRVSASVRESKPEADYYFQLEITYIDVGDANLRSTGPIRLDEDGWSHVLATGRIVRADTGDTVAELSFDQSSGDGTRVAFQDDMTNLGQELGNWITSRQ